MKLAGFLFLLLPAALVSAIIAYVGWALPRYRRSSRRPHVMDALDNQNWY